MGDRRGLALAYLCDDVFELALLPGVGGVAHHGDDGVVVLLVLVVQEHKLRPQVGLLRRPQHLSRETSERSQEGQGGVTWRPARGHEEVTGRSARGQREVRERSPFCMSGGVSL